jgi:hypothetical protein
VCYEGETPAEGGEIHEVCLSVNGQGKCGWDNLPKDFERGMKNISEEEQRSSPITALRVVANSVGKPEILPPPSKPEQ